MKLRLNEDYVIELPLQVCEPLNADFDGDTVAIHLVAPEAADDTYKKMSPRYMNIYKKNLEGIYNFKHEALNGLAVATEVKGKPEEIDNPKEYYNDYAELVKDAELRKRLPINKPIIFDGVIDGIEYKNKKTTYGRLRVSKIVKADIDHIEGLKPYPERINAKTAAKLSLYLYQFPDGVERIKELQEYVLKVVTKAGVVTFDYKTLWTDTDTKTYKKIREVADNPKLSDQQKLLILTDIHAKYQKELADSFSDDLKAEMSMANRVKMDSIIDMVAPALIVSGVEEKPVVLKNTLVTGLTESDYHYHAIENRSLQSIKNSGTPKSGLVLSSL
jgi:DNA-directed RNA polymerase beta' subunit